MAVFCSVDSKAHIDYLRPPFCVIRNIIPVFTENVIEMGGDERNLIASKAAVIRALRQVFIDLRDFRRASVRSLEELCFVMKVMPHMESDSTKLKNRLLSEVLEGLIPPARARLEQLFHVELGTWQTEMFQEATAQPGMVYSTGSLTVRALSESGQALASIMEGLRVFEASSAGTETAETMTTNGVFKVPPVLSMDIDRNSEFGKVHNLLAVPTRADFHGVEILLQSVTVHTGEDGNGHYFAFVVNPETQRFERWSDTEVREATEEEMNAVYRGGERPFEENPFVVTNCVYIRADAFWMVRGAAAADYASSALTPKRLDRSGLVMQHKAAAEEHFRKQQERLLGASRFGPAPATTATTAATTASGEGRKRKTSEPSSEEDEGSWARPFKRHVVDSAPSLHPALAALSALIATPAAIAAAASSVAAAAVSSGPRGSKKRCISEVSEAEPFAEPGVKVTRSESTSWAGRTSFTCEPSTLREARLESTSWAGRTSFTCEPSTLREARLDALAWPQV